MDVKEDYIFCSICELKLNKNEYEFLDVYSDFNGRDVIKFKCKKCFKETESFVFIGKK